METLKFNHEAENITKAFGLPRKFDETAKEMVLFSTINNYLEKERFLKDNPNDIPPRITTTMTGDLETTFPLCKSDAEILYITFMFKQLHDICIDSITKYELYHDLTSKDQEKAMKILLRFEKEIAKEKEISDMMLLPTEVFKKIDILKKKKYTYEEYFACYKEITGVEDLLADALKGSDDEKLKDTE